MMQAVVFDFYGTLARWADGDGWHYATVLADLGYDVPPGAMQEYFVRDDGVEHPEHSVSEAAYDSWVRARLGRLVSACGVPEDSCTGVVDELQASDRRPMAAYPEAEGTLGRLREAGLRVAVCSNWGWQLDPYLDEVGLLGLVDTSVTSARVGARKPHPAIYAHVSDLLGVSAASTLFVGDSWEPDVRGPRRNGMEAVHVWRSDERAGQEPPALHHGDHRVADLSALLDLPGLLVDA